MKKLLIFSLIAVLLVSFVVYIAYNDTSESSVQTSDMNEMIIGTEIPYLLYSNNDYCIMNMLHGGIIIYSFITQEISDRITFNELENVGFSYPKSIVSEDGKNIYFREDGQQSYSYYYNIDTKKLSKNNSDIEITNHYESIFENKMTQTLLLDNLAYGETMITLEDIFVVSRLVVGGSMLSDVEIVFLDKNLNIQNTFFIFDE